MSQEIPKAYQPKAVESRLYQWWEKKGFFQAQPDSDKPKYSIVLPPPNVTGSLHMGHALNITLQDILIRWKRMQGFDVLWVPGTDHAGIATQNVVERQLAEQGKKRADLGRKKFEELVWKWKEEAESNILNQARRLGCSCDWTHKRFTLDEGLSRAVREVFVRLYQEGLIYRGEYLVNWCPRCTTAISDLEVEYRPTVGKLWYLRYPVKGSDQFVVVATTRPETMLGDSAVAIHPEDKRHRHLHRETIILPLMEREIPVIRDDFVDLEFGTGIVKVTPGHDPNDFEAGRRHQLPIQKVIGEDGHMTPSAGSFAGMDRYQARRQVVEALEKEGLLEKVEKHSHNVGHCQRCETVVEPLVSTQWFVKARPLSDPTVSAVEQGRTVFVPQKYRKVYFEWMNNIHDWCISRQLWWGHRIPAWYCSDCDEITVSLEIPTTCASCQGSDLKQETDVLDTWFSSALWPFSTLGWPDETADLKRYYPTDTLVTGFDIIFFWVARMMMMGLRFGGDVPFRTVHINGLVRDEQGQKMSKSRGNVIDPLEIMDEYGTDAMRFTLAIMAVPGTDIPFSISRMAGYRAFCNKLWNAGRFLLLNLEDGKPVTDDEIAELKQAGGLDLAERWMLSRLQEVTASTHLNLEKFRFHEASNDLYHFVWHEFCDWFIEWVKPSLVGDQGEGRDATRRLAGYVFERSLRLLHPFIPFITEELWQQLPHEGDSVMVAAYPASRPEWRDGEAEQQMKGLQELITGIRTSRSENNLDPRRKIPLELLCRPEYRSLLASEQQKIESLARLSQIQLVEGWETEGPRAVGVTRMADFALVLDEVVDQVADRQRLEQQIGRCLQNVEQLQRRLENRDFLEKAPEQVVTAARERHADEVEQLHKLRGKLDEISGA